MIRRSTLKQRHLDCFLAIVRTGSIHAAAQELNLSQPALSRTLADLEEKLGAKLMNRSRTGVSLTNAGEIFMRHAMASVSALDEGLAQVAQAQNDDRPSVTIGALPNVQARLMPDVVKKFMQLHPGVVVRIMEGTNRQLMQMLRLGEVDFVVGRLAAPDDMFGLSFDPLYSEELVAVVRPDHPILRLPDPASVAAMLSSLPQILPVRGTIIRENAEQLVLAAGARVSDEVIETMSVSYCRAFLQITDAVWMTVRGVVTADIETGFLAQLEINTAATRGWVGVTTRQKYPLSRYSERFLAVLKQFI